MISLDDDIITHVRPASATDDEGNFVGAAIALPDFSGFLGMPQSRDLDVAGGRGVIVDGVVATQYSGDIQLGDRLTIFDVQWEVVIIEDVRIHRRLFLRRGD